MRSTSCCWLAAVVLVAATLLSSSPAAAQQPAGQPRPAAPANAAPGGGGAAGGCACPREFNPVCGVDGAFFPNKCLAKCVGTKVSDKKPKDGKCGYILNQAKQQQQQQQKPPQQQQQQQKPPQQAPRPPANVNDCSCPQDVAIVCGTANNKQQNYQSACYARCFDAQVLYNGPCRANGNTPAAAAAAPRAGPASGQGVVTQPTAQAQGVMMQGTEQQYLQPDPLTSASGLSGLTGLTGLTSPAGQLALPAGSYLQPSPFGQVQCRCSRLRLPVCAVDPQGTYQTVLNRCTANCWGAGERCHRTGWSGPCLAHLGRCHSHETGRASLFGR